MLPITVQTWIDDLWVTRDWNEQRDAPRLATAFRLLRGSCERWPTQKLFNETLPKREPLLALGHSPTDEEREFGRQKVRELVGALAAKKGMAE